MPCRCGWHYMTEMLTEAGPTRLRVLVQEVTMCSGKKWITNAKGLLCNGSIIFIVFRIVVEQQTTSEKEDKV